MLPLNREVLRRTAAVLLPVAIGLAGAWLGMLVAGREDARAGPFELQLTASPGPGLTDIALPPFGLLTADTHEAPLRFRATLTSVDIPELTRLARTRTLGEAAADVEAEFLDHVLPFALRVLGVSVAGALVAALVAFRLRWRPVVGATVSALFVVGGSELTAWATFRPASFLSPRFSGTLELAPGLIGPVRTATDRIGEFRGELQRIVDGAARVFASIQASPLTAGPEIKVLHISDVHLSPLGAEFARQLAEAFDVDVVLDTGDLTSFGTPAERLILSFVPRLRRPYVFVRGNHDSVGLQAAMRDVENAVVLDGDSATVAGITFYGRGDPTFTPNRRAAPQDDDEREALFDLAGERTAEDLLALPEPPDVLAVHNDRTAVAAAGLVPLVLAGHDHVASAKVIEDTLFLRVGTTGGAGATVFTEEGGIPLSAQILYFEPGDPPTLLAFDVIEQSPESGSLQVERHLVAEEFGDLAPSPSPTSSPPSPLPGLTTTPGVDG